MMIKLKSSPKSLPDTMAQSGFAGRRTLKPLKISYQTTPNVDEEQINAAFDYIFELVLKNRQPKNDFTSKK